MAFCMPDGQRSNGRETWRLVQNPNGSEVMVEFTYMTSNGNRNVSRKEAIPANSRRTYNMSAHSGIVTRAAVMVESGTSGKAIICERAMYWNDRGAGTGSIGCYSD